MLTLNKILRTALLLSFLVSLSSCSFLSESLSIKNLGKRTYFEEDLRYRSEILEIGEIQTAEGWWNALSDSSLSRLISLVLANNLEIRMALEKEEEAKYSIKHTRSHALPSVIGYGSLMREQQSLNGLIPPFPNRVNDLLDTNLSLEWNLDLNGQLRHRVNASQRHAEAVEAQSEQVKVRVMTEVMQLYFSLRSDQQEQLLRQKYLKNYETLIQLTQQKIAFGLVPNLELDDLYMQFHLGESELLDIEARIRSAVILLSLYTGGLPEQEIFLENSFVDLTEMKWPIIPVGEREELLSFRPDVRAAEQEWKASELLWKASRSQRGPDFSLNASVGHTSQDSLSLLKESSQRWRVQPVIRWKLFEGGRIEAEINEAHARRNIAFIQYKHVVLGALSEVEKSLTEYYRSKEAWLKQKKAVYNARNLYEKMLQAYQYGAINQIELLDSEQKYLATQEVLARTMKKVSYSFSHALKSLGGQWFDESSSSPKEAEKS